MAGRRALGGTTRMGTDDEHTRGATNGRVPVGSRVRVMRRRVVSWVFAGAVGLMAPVAAASPAVEDGRDTVAPTPVAVQRVSVPAFGLRDEAAMVLVGTALIGLAAAVRRAA